MMNKQQACRGQSYTTPPSYVLGNKIPKEGRERSKCEKRVLGGEKMFLTISNEHSQPRYRGKEWSAFPSQIGKKKNWLAQRSHTHNLGLHIVINITNSPHLTTPNEEEEVAIIITCLLQLSC